MFGWLKSRRRFKTPAYSLAIRRTKREGAYVVYRGHGKELVFDGELVGKKWKQINLRAPSNFAEERSPDILANLSEGLDRLGYEYVIFKTGPSEPIPEHERQTALAGLHKMGLEPEVSQDGSTVKLKKLSNWSSSPPFDPNERAIAMTRLVRTARGIRKPVEILAKSGSANTDFV